MTENTEMHTIQFFENNKLISQGKGKLPISSAKYNDLKRFCEKGTIPKRFRADYIKLPFKSDEVETLLNTDEEDEKEDS